MTPLEPDQTMYVRHAVADRASPLVHVVPSELAAPVMLNRHDAGPARRATAGYRRIRPIGLIPGLQTPEDRLFETDTILPWRSKRHGMAPAPAPLAPALRARVGHARLARRSAKTWRPTWTSAPDLAQPPRTRLTPTDLSRFEPAHAIQPSPVQQRMP